MQLCAILFITSCTIILTQINSKSVNIIQMVLCDCWYLWCRKLTLPKKQSMKNSNKQHRKLNMRHPILFIYNLKHLFRFLKCKIIEILRVIKYSKLYKCESESLSLAVSGSFLLVPKLTQISHCSTAKL